jgi:hypothetical protein
LCAWPAPILGFFSIGLIFLLAFASEPAQSQGAISENQGAVSPCYSHVYGSPYIPVDSWIYPAAWHLYSLGYLDRIYLGMRPWTRTQLGRILDAAANILVVAPNSDTESDAERTGALETYNELLRFLQEDTEGLCRTGKNVLRAESAYTIARVITGTSLRDSFHFGSTIVNDYGRPYESGFNSYSGLSGYAVWKRFTFYGRGELQHAPSAAGYPLNVARDLAAIDNQNIQSPSLFQSSIPTGPIAAVTQADLLEAYIFVQVWRSNMLSFGKQDVWYGPGLGAGMAYSNNAENVVSFRVNRIEPMRIPLLSRALGPFRYDFLVGPLKGHIYPKAPWVHAEKFSFRPTRNLEMGFARSVVWGGKGHTPVTMRTFLNSFLSFSTHSKSTGYDPNDPGSRHSSWDFSYRLPFVRDWLTLYTDSIVHDDVSPLGAPWRSGWRPGLYLSHFPKAPKLDFRVEAAYTDIPIWRSRQGRNIYWEHIFQQGLTNNGQIIGDWMGREAKGGQAWLTYHLSGNEWLQASARRQKIHKRFIPGGSTLDNFEFEAVKRVHKDIEIRGRFTFEQWLIPEYLTTKQTVTGTEFGITWYPARKENF